MIQITVCPSCGGDEITEVQQDWTGRFQGRSYTVPALQFYQCQTCGERIYDREAMQKIEAYSPAFAGGHLEKAGAASHA